MPPGKLDEYYLFFSGGHSGQVIVAGVPSMRMLEVIGVFTPEPWQGYGTGGLGESAVLAGGKQNGRTLRWGDVHHPALSETKGDYDGQFLFVNDKANARVAVIDLKDFVTKQIVSDPLIASNHGATFVTPNTEYVIEGSQYPAPLGRAYADISTFKDTYRGAVTFWKFDRAKGRIDPSQSWAIELPPYSQDLADAGELSGPEPFLGATVGRCLAVARRSPGRSPASASFSPPSHARPNEPSSTPSSCGSAPSRCTTSRSSVSCFAGTCLRPSCSRWPP